MRFLAMAAAAALFVGGMVDSAKAETIRVALTGVTGDAVSSTYSYAAELQGGDGDALSPASKMYGDGTSYFAIFDVPYLDAAATAALTPANWLFVPEATTTFQTGDTSFVYGFDGATLNAKFVYTGATLGPASPNVPLGTFQIVTSISGAATASGLYASRDTKVVSGVPESASSFTEAILTPAVPLPAAAWAGLALFGAIGAARVRRSMKA